MGFQRIVLKSLFSKSIFRKIILDFSIFFIFFKLKITRILIFIKVFNSLLNIDFVTLFR